MQAPLAIITGATGGIGSCLARRLASEGWALHLIDLDEPRLENLCAELPGATFSASDLATPESCQNALPNHYGGWRAHCFDVVVVVQSGPGRVCGLHDGQRRNCRADAISVSASWCAWDLR